jgi:glycosyltransferase involved in cell wall biosynthesis
MSVTVIIPTFDEALHIEACLASVSAWARRVYVLDSFSTDATVALAEGFGAPVEVVQHAYDGPADQKNWALDNLAIDSDWVLFLDADELVTPELRDEIERVTQAQENAVCGYFINRRIIWHGQWIRHGGWFPNWNLRLFRFGKARYHMRRVHEHMISEGPTAHLEGHLVHEDLRDLTHAIDKHNRYSNLEAQEYLAARHGAADDYARLFTRDPLARKRWLKHYVWSKLPCKALCYFAYAYFLRLGFLDGRVGLRYHALHAIFKHFDALKLWELESGAGQAEADTPTYADAYWSERGESLRRKT